MIIYKTTNLLNGKIYIGKACGKNITSNYLGSGLELSLDLREFGKCSFSRTTIDVAESGLDQNRKEIFWIAFYREKLGESALYNVSDGGDGRKLGKGLSDETKARMRIKMLGRKRPDVSETNRSRIGTKNPMYGKKRLDISEMNRLRWTNYRKTKEKRNGTI